jgi:hypothetical protein
MAKKQGPIRDADGVRGVAKILMLPFVAPGHFALLQIQVESDPLRNGPGGKGGRDYGPRAR